MADVHLEYVDDVYMKVVADPSILMEIADSLSFFAKNYRFNKRFKAKIWNGKISLLNRLTRLVYVGLAKRIKKFCDLREYSISFDPRLIHDDVSINEFISFIKELHLPDWLEIRDYQVEGVVKALRSKRRVLVSPTSSGKSFMIYLLSQWYKKKTLIIVPTIGLVTQFKNDIFSYGFKGSISTSIDGFDDIDTADIVITTWQSLDNGKTRKPEEWYKQFEMVVGDEAHQCKADILIKIMKCTDNVHYKFGTTGTMPDDRLDVATIEGLFGPIHQTITSREMMDRGFSSKLNIKMIVLKYPEEDCKRLKELIVEAAADTSNKSKAKTYQKEIDYLINHEGRNNFIKNLTLSLSGNKLIFFRLTAHGEILHNKFEGQPDVFYIDGDVKADNREAIRHAIEDKQDAILVASLGTTSTGISINRLMHMIAAFPNKSKIKVLQSIGRMLRKHEEKEESGATLYDIVDDLSMKSFTNQTLKHARQRITMYDNEKFDYKIYNVGMKKK